MSETSLYLAYKTKVSCYEQYKNGYGSGPAIWDLMVNKYLGLDHYNMLGNFSGKDEYQKLWDLATDEKVEKRHRITHASTFDYAMIPVAHLEEAGIAFELTHQDIIQGPRWEWSHWGELGGDIRKIAEKPDRRLKGIVIGCTSVNDPWEYWTPEEREPWDAFTLAANCGKKE